MHEDVIEPEFEEEEAEQQSEDPNRWKSVTEDWTETRPPVEVAKEHYQRGTEAYRKGDYEGALDGFRAAYDLQPLDPLRYNIARCLEKLDRLGEAILELDALARAAEDPSLRSQASEHRDKLRRQLELSKMPTPP